MTWLWCIAHTPCLDPGDHCWLQPEMQYSQLDLSHKGEDDESSLMMRILVNMMTTSVTTIMIIMLLAMVVICSNSHGCEFSFRFTLQYNQCFSHYIELIVASRLKWTPDICTFLNEHLVFEMEYLHWDWWVISMLGFVNWEASFLLQSMVFATSSCTLIVPPRLKHKSRNPQIPFFLLHSSTLPDNFANIWF